MMTCLNKTCPQTLEEILYVLLKSYQTPQVEYRPAETVGLSFSYCLTVFFLHPGM